MFYSAGLSSIISDNYQTFASLFNNITVKTLTKEEKLFFYLHKTGREPIDNKKAEILIGSENVIALSIYLSQQLREFFKESLPSNIDYQKAFDKFEYLLSLIVADKFYSDTEDNTSGPIIWGPVGNFAFRSTYSEDGINFVNAKIISVELKEEQLKWGNEWWPLKVGFFNSETKRFNLIKEKYDAFVASNYKQFRPYL